MKEKEFATIGEYLYWRYANMAMAHVALKNSREKYEVADYMIRAKLYKGLCTGNMNIASLYDDEKYKLNNISCCYCGGSNELTLDHIIPKFSGGKDTGDNIMYACKTCNSSKNKNDLLVWYQKRNEFPPILVLRRYLKLAFINLKEAEKLDFPIDQLENNNRLFRIDLLPYQFPQPNLLRL
ncbi:HNH endonuclease [Enterococcus timonensis]|uniref:HNH endonuclease n=1 Tax=Enterococcus timonensis TaxID=1852364 RepID=UPI0008DA3B58|nr:HNH endonuclease [Enterococcus timonensis]